MKLIMSDAKYFCVEYFKLETKLIAKKKQKKLLILMA